MVKSTQMLIPILWLVSLTFAEPPVGDGYSAARSSHDDHHHDHHESENQRFLSQEYGPPNSGSVRNSHSTGYEYNTPNVRGSSNARGQSRFPPATIRVSFNQRFGSHRSSARSSGRDNTAPTTRSDFQEHSALNTQSALSQEYGAPVARSLSEEYGTPSIESARTLSSEYGVTKARSSPSEAYGPPAAGALSQEYGAPSVVSARTLSTEYGMPDARSSPSQEYGVPVLSGRSNQKPHSSSSIRSVQSANHLNQEHSTPAARSQFQTDSLSHGFEAPESFTKSDFTSQSAPSFMYGAPSLRSQMNSHGNSLARNADSQSYDGQTAHSKIAGGSKTRGVSQEYGVPSSRTNLMTSAIPTSYASASSRSSPSSTYLPAARNSAPSEQYGVPEDRDGDSQGYDDSRARALEELQNQEPANYDFGYQIEDQESGSDFGHTEKRQENSAQGSYFVVLPDGTKQTVEYEADERGFQPRVSVEPAPSGYESAANARSDQGPY